MMSQLIVEKKDDDRRDEPVIPVMSRNISSKVPNKFLNYPSISYFPLIIIIIIIIISLIITVIINLTTTKLYRIYEKLY